MASSCYRLTCFELFLCSVLIDQIILLNPGNCDNEVSGVRVHQYVQSDDPFESSSWVIVRASKITNTPHFLNLSAFNIEAGCFQGLISTLLVASASAYKAALLLGKLQYAGIQKFCIHAFVSEI